MGVGFARAVHGAFLWKMMFLYMCWRMCEDIDGKILFWGGGNDE